MWPSPQVLLSVHAQIESYVAARPDYPALITQAWRFLLAKDQDSKFRGALSAVDSRFGTYVAGGCTHTSAVSSQSASRPVVTSLWTRAVRTAPSGRLWLCLLPASCRPALPFPHKPRAACSPSSCTQSSSRSSPPSPRSTASLWTVRWRSSSRCNS